MIVKGKKPKRKPRAETAEAYAARLAWTSKANAKATAAFRDFGKIPPIGNRKRKSAARKSFRVFCETYLPATFSKPWGPDHLVVIDRLERAVRLGGLFAVAMPRGSGKTSLTEAAALWAVLFGFRRFVVLIGATERHAESLLASIAMELETNELLLADFPAICFPIRKLEGSPLRRLLCLERRVSLSLTNKEIHLPWIQGATRQAPGAGSIILVRGITGAVRGIKDKLPNGEAIRPDFVIPDDPQTDESAGSTTQVENREGILAGAILGLAGPGEKIAGVCPCTVMQEGDLADRLLTRELYPEWLGERFAFIKEFPTRTDLWEKYAEERVESLRVHGDIRAATRFYKSNRVEMDLGSSVSWDSRFEAGELSAIQHGMNRKLANERSFWSEFQNDPRASTDEEIRIQTPKELAARTNGGDQFDAMAGSQVITGFIDVQKKGLFYMLCSWRSDFTGSVIDYGTFPDQGRRYYSLADMNKTLARRYPGVGATGAITKGLTEAVGKLCGRPYRREDDDAELSPSLVLIDANWQTATIRDFCRRLRSTQIVPVHGRYVGASSKPITEYKKGKGEQIGLHWKSSTIERMKHVLFDANFWKSFIHERLGIEFGDRGNLTFFGTEPDAHRMLAENLVAEYRVRVENTATGRTVDEWKHKASRPDNHFLDCLVGCAVAASIMGVTLPEVGGAVGPGRKRRRRRRVSYG